MYNTRGPLYSTELLFMALISQQEKRTYDNPNNDIGTTNYDNF
ncbi:MAG: hypothetical protein WAM27_01490 [Nitrososphaeraceae archaeon]